MTTVILEGMMPMPFVSLPGLNGKIYVPEHDPERVKKHNCANCFSCQVCSDERCSLCLDQKCRGKTGSSQTDAQTG